MTPLDFFDMEAELLKAASPDAQNAPAADDGINKPSRMTSPLATEMVVNEQIKVKVTDLKPKDEKKSPQQDTAALIERIKAKLRREFDLTTPVERNDDDYQRKPSRTKGETPAASNTLDKALDIPADDALFQKQYYTMGQVSEMFHVNQSMLRFWENEFDILKPKKNKKGDRYFRPVDIKNLELIYHLLRQRKFTIDGAKTFLKQQKQKAADSFAAVQSLEKLKAFLVELKTNI